MCLKIKKKSVYRLHISKRIYFFQQKLYFRGAVPLSIFIWKALESWSCNLALFFSITCSYCTILYQEVEQHGLILKRLKISDENFDGCFFKLARCALLMRHTDVKVFNSHSLYSCLVCDAFITHSVFVLH